MTSPFCLEIQTESACLPSEANLINIPIDPFLLLPRMINVKGSLIINEYIACQFPGRSLWPESASEQAIARVWLHYCDQVLTEILNRWHQESDRKTKASVVNELDAALDRLELRVSSAVGNRHYWSGNRIGLVDIGISVFFDSMNYGSDHSLRRLIRSKPRLQDWSEAIGQAASIRRAQAIADDFHKDGTSCIISP